MPGHTAKSQKPDLDRWPFPVGPEIYQETPIGALEFIRMACGKEWQLRAAERGNAPPRGSVLRDPAMVAKLGWPPVAAEAIETGFPTPAHPAFDALELSLRTPVCPRPCSDRRSPRMHWTRSPVTGNAACAARV